MFSSPKQIPSIFSGGPENNISWEPLFRIARRSLCFCRESRLELPVLFHFHPLHSCDSKQYRRSPIILQHVIFLSRRRIRFWCHILFALFPSGGILPDQKGHTRRNQPRLCRPTTYRRAAAKHAKCHTRRGAPLVLQRLSTIFFQSDSTNEKTGK